MTAARTITLPGGRRMRVPQCIQRIDTGRTHGWQVRYQGTKLFSDGVHGGPRPALRAATAELDRRIRTLPAPVTLRRQPGPSKTSKLPVGISGPVWRERRPGRAREGYFLVHLPRFGAKPQHRSLYIGSRRTATRARREAVLEQAIELRAAAELRYRREATRARRAEAAR